MHICIYIYIYIYIELYGASHSAGHTVLLNTWHLISVSIDKTPHPTNTLDWSQRFAGPYHDLSRALVVWQDTDPTLAAVCAVEHADLPAQFLAVAREQWPGRPMDTVSIGNLFDARPAQAVFRARVAAAQSADGKSLQVRAPPDAWGRGHEVRTHYIYAYIYIYIYI